MEFEEMKKIWDEQNNETLFAINEVAMHKSISARSKKISRAAAINEIGLISIVLATGLFLLVDAIKDNDGVNGYLSILVWLLIGVYVIAMRIKRKKSITRFDRSMLGELDHAIETSNHLINRNKTFLWWFLLPSAISIGLNMSQYEVPLWKWIVVPFSFVLSYFVVSIGLKHSEIPRRRRLETLRKKLTEEMNN